MFSRFWQTFRAKRRRKCKFKLFFTSICSNSTQNWTIEGYAIIPWNGHAKKCRQFNQKTCFTVIVIARKLPNYRKFRPKCTKKGQNARNVTWNCTNNAEIPNTWEMAEILGNSVISILTEHRRSQIIWTLFSAQQNVMSKWRFSHLQYFFCNFTSQHKALHCSW